MTIGTKLYTAFFGSRAGEDEFGNRYYTSGKGRRWVLYKGIAEGSKVPAEWHRWLHKTTDEVPSNVKKYDWEKPHLPNLSGTEHAYAPKGHLKKGHDHGPVTGEYQAWEPKE
jgi:NADH:ubiquinone oxidoreductase subunit